MSLESRVKEVVAKHLLVKPAQIKWESSFVNDLGADSLDAVGIAMEIEEEFNIKIDDEEAEKLDVFGKMVDYVKSHVTK